MKVAVVTLVPRITGEVVPLKFLEVLIHVTLVVVPQRQGECRWRGILDTHLALLFRLTFTPIIV